MDGTPGESFIEETIVPMKFDHARWAVVGAGPVGCTIAAFLARGGCDVTLCDMVPELVADAVDKGITVEGAEHFQQRVSRICTHIDALKEINPDVVVITVKANALPLIASAVHDFYRDGMYVVSWQNGIGTEDELARGLGRAVVMRAVVNYGCQLIQPCYVFMAFHHSPHFLQELDSHSREAAAGIVAVLTGSGLITEHTNQIVPIVWRKSILNAAMNAVCAITGMTMAQAMNDPIIFQMVSALLKECIQVARANEIPLGWDFYANAVAYLKTAGDHKPSMLLDIESNRKTEIDFINGKFIEFGNQASVATPYNSSMRALVKGLESKRK